MDTIYIYVYSTMNDGRKLQEQDSWILWDFASWSPQTNGFSLKTGPPFDGQVYGYNSV
jgi:hypothetical protein